ncbi:unnamed protein product [Notodromas monacha]|uniref:Peptidase S1 domain-containing protein n=1 Tax=Notodromas monacha TaxID=399045 RepID=A0A7R9BRH1_9CRUS|nr:unnamed protein product [Notodromas monacha]CAG0920326.1 unnamed protein product [Notodromas monacha]
MPNICNLMVEFLSIFTDAWRGRFSKDDPSTADMSSQLGDEFPDEDGSVRSPAMWQSRGSDDSQVCVIDGTEFACKFSLFCWMTGGEAAGPCTGGALSTCCVPRDFNARTVVVSRSRRKYEFVHTPPRLVEAPVRNDPVCGRPRLTLQKRIIGGSEANFGELPWQVHIRISGYQCGGVLLNHFFVATAAHCVHKAHIPLIQVHIGDHDTKNTGAFFEPMPSDTFAVDEIIIHPFFKFMSVQPDSIGELDYGVLESLRKTGTNILNKVPVPVISNRECKKWHGLKNIRVALHDEMTCAGWMDGKMDACLGDSGSPLIVNDRGRWTLIGITSAGFGCAVDHQPGIYHRVAKTAAWISAMIW